MSSLIAITLLWPVLLLLILATRGRTFFSRRSRTRLPPSPFKLPIIGNLHQLGSLPHRSLHALSQKHGPLMLLQLGQVPTLVVSSPDAAREVMRTQDHVFANRPFLKVPGRLLYGCKDVAFAPHGEYWRNARKLSVLHLLSPQKVRSYRTIREEEVALMVDKITDLSSSSLGSVNMSEVLSSFAKDVISRIAFGKCSREEGWNDVIDVLIEESNELLGSFHVGDYIPSLAWVSAVSGLDARVEETFKKADQILDAIVECSNGRHENKAFVDVLLSLMKDPNMGFPSNKESIKAIMEDLFGAGTDSTLIVLEWCMAELLHNPKIMNKLQNEVRGLANAKAMIQEEDLIEMSYLKSVIKEVLRLHPPGPLLVPRESMKNTHIFGYNIAKKTRVIINAWAIGRDPAFWEDPEEFRPERFMGSHIDFKGNDFQLIPFGSGRRVCPGIFVAISIIELALANITYRFNWTLPHGMTVDDMDMHEAQGITSRKKIGLHMVAKSYLYH